MEQNASFHEPMRQAHLNLKSYVLLGRLVMLSVRFWVLLQAKALLQPIMANAAAAGQARVKSLTWIIILAILSGSDGCVDHCCPCCRNEGNPTKF
jgi:hypothetical protein